MSTSQGTTTYLKEPVGDEPISFATVGYTRARNRQAIYNIVMAEFDKSGVSKATLAKRMRKPRSRITALLRSPGNWTLDTVCDLLFAMGGGMFSYTITYPAQRRKTDRRTKAMALLEYGAADTLGRGRERPADWSRIQSPSDYLRVDSDVAVRLLEHSKTDEKKGATAWNW